MRVSYVKLLLSLTVMASACGGTTTPLDISQPPIRTGGQLESIPINYYDLSPSLSADGTKVVFVSGRDTTAEGAQLRVYRADWPADGKPGKAERVTSEDLGLEQVAVVSPDGSTIAVVIAKENKTNIYTIPYAGGSLTAVTEDAVGITRLQFSDDGALLAWMSSEGGTKTAFVGDVSGANTKPLSVEGVRDVFWIPTGVAGSYKTGILAAAETAGQSLLKTATFTDVATAAAAAFVDLGEPMIAGDEEVQALAERVMMSRRVLPAGSQVIARLGDFADTKPEDLFASNVENVPVLVATSDGSVTELAAPAGDSVQSFNLVNDGMHFLSRNSFRCLDDKSVGFVRSLASAAIDGTGLVRRYPRRNQSGDWEVASDVCDRMGSDEVVGKIDEMITEFRTAKGGSLAGFRGAYVSRFSMFRDRQCQLKAGDPEVRLIEVGDTSSIYELSENPFADLGDTDRGDDGPCP